MTKTIKRDFNREAGSALSEMIAAHADEELTIRELSQLVTPLLDGRMLDGIKEEAVVLFIHRILRSAVFKDEHGDKVRKFHSYITFAQTTDGKEKQLDIWTSIETMTRAQMFLSAKARLDQAKKINAHVAIDVRYWDAHVSSSVHSRSLLKELGLTNVNEVP